MSKFLVTVKGDLWSNGKVIKAEQEGVVAITETPCSKYGNGKYLKVESGLESIPKYERGQDIRYDTDYNKMTELDYVKDFMKYWLKSWDKVDSIEVEEIKETK